MAVMMYKTGEDPIAIDHREMIGYESMGWSIHENLERLAELIEDVADKNDDDELRAMAVAEYEVKFGEKPHHRMKLETILEKVNGNEPVQP